LREYVQKPVIQDVEHKITCNCCGREYIFTGDKSDDYYYPNQFHNILIPLEYGSKFDTYNITNIEFDICDECLEKFMKTFKYNPLNNQE
jgi:hypothetical protein